MANSRNIQYTGRDFDSIKSQLIEYARNYFPDTYTDFTPASPGMMFMEMVAYVGDILSFYQDIQLQETFLQYAKNPSNLYNLAYMLGYRPKVTAAATVELTVSQVIDAVEVGGQMVPDWSKTYLIAENAQVVDSGAGKVSFLTESPVDFSYSSSFDPTDISIYSTDDLGEPSQFLLTKKVKAYSGTVKTQEFTFGSYQKYPTVEINDSNIIGILEAKGSDGDEDLWYEVPCLGQDTIFVDSLNTSSDYNQARYVLELQKVPKRYVTRFTTENKLQIQFGSGMYAEDVDTWTIFLPDPTSTQQIQGISNNRFDVAYDPSNFLYSKSYGLAPANKTITFKYVVGGGVSSNVDSYTLTVPGQMTITVKDGSTADRSRVSFYNGEAASGGRNGDELEEIRQNTIKAFAEQKRMVTLNDFTVRALSMPSRYGAVSKAYATTDTVVKNNNTSILKQNPLAVSLYVLGYDSDGKLKACSETMKNNLKAYLSEYLMLTDAIDLKDIYIINLGVQYDIVLRPNYNSRDVLLKCNTALQNYMKTVNRAVNSVINISELYSLLDQIPGVQTVKSIRINNKNGEGYSAYGYDVEAAIKNDILYPSYDISVFEVKYPEVDIEGRVTTL